VTNKESGKKLIREAERLVGRDLRSALEEGDFNMTVRRSQETVELVLKGALKILGIDYPKVHEVSRIFTRRVREKLPDIEEDSLTRIENISMWLSEARAPSFYFEKDYTVEDAQRAFQDATFVFNRVREMLDRVLR
jgi:HEPN domain-containing protein